MKLDKKFEKNQSASGGLGWEYESDEVHIFGYKLMNFYILAYISSNIANRSKLFQKFT